MRNSLTAVFFHTYSKKNISLEYYLKSGIKKRMGQLHSVN